MQYQIKLKFKKWMLRPRLRFKMPFIPETNGCFLEKRLIPGLDKKCIR